MLQGWPGSLARMNEARGRPGNGPGVARLVGAVALVALTSCLGDVVSADRGVGAPGGTGRTTAAACPKATANALTFKGPTGCVRISALVGRDCPESGMAFGSSIGDRHFAKRRNYN